MELSNKKINYKCNATPHIEMKYGDIHILYESCGDVTEKIKNTTVTVLILPNVEILDTNNKK